MAEFSVDAPPSEVANKLKNILPSVGFTFLGEIADDRRTRIELNGIHGITMRSWGERIKIEITENGEGKSRVHALSVPVAKTTMVDWGQNRANLRKILKELERTYPNIAPLKVKTSIIGEWEF